MRVFILGFLFWAIFTIFARWYFVCEIRHHCGQVETPHTTRPMTLNLTEGDSVILEGYEQFAFDTASIEPILTENNTRFLEAVADYLKNNPDKNLTITGRFLESEKEAPSGIFENLGIARAAIIEQRLEERGIAEERMTIDYEMANATILEEPLSFSLYMPGGSPDEYTKLQFRFEDMTFSDANFEFGSDEFRPGQQCILYADSVKTFLDENAGMTLVIIGHTDSVDTENFNYELGLKRAESAADYFRELGVSAPIKVESKGETEPVAPNSNPAGADNPEGRQKNRRVNFILQPDSEGN